MSSRSQRITVATVENWKRGKELMHFFLERLKSRTQITENVMSAALENGLVEMN
jgi:hypothetical protein